MEGVQIVKTFRTSFVTGASVLAWWRYAQMRQFLPPKGSEMAGQSMELTLACVHTATGSRKAKW